MTASRSSTSQARWFERTRQVWIAETLPYPGPCSRHRSAIQIITHKGELTVMSTTATAASQQSLCDEANSLIAGTINQIIRAAHSSLVKVFSEGIFKLDYNQRITIPTELVQRVYSLIDHEQVLASLRSQVNEHVASVILHSLTTELSTDVKKTLQHEPTRLRLRMAVAAELDRIKVEKVEAK